MYRDNNFHSRRQLRIKVSLRILSLYAFKQKLGFKEPKLCFKAGFPLSFYCQNKNATFFSFYLR